MAPLDIIILVIVGISGAMSFRVGLIREAFALGALLIGLLAAVVLGRVYGNEIPDVFGNAVATQALFFLLCFLVFYVLVTLLGAAVGRLIKAMKLRWIDHVLGIVFGCVRGTILTILLLAGLTLILPEEHGFLARSRGFRLAEEPIRGLAKLLPEKAEEALEGRHAIYRGLRRYEKQLREEAEKRKDEIKAKGSSFGL